MKKVFDHAVIFNGKFYPAGEEIEVTEKADTKAVEKDVDKRTGAKPKARNNAD